MGEVFSQTCKALVQHLGPRTFHVRAGLNSAVYDAVMLAFSSHLDSIPSDVKARYKKLVYSADFERRTRGGTTDVDTVKERIRLANEKLFENKPDETAAS
jgi:hypothetical protein